MSTTLVLLLIVILVLCLVVGRAAVNAMVDFFRAQSASVTHLRILPRNPAVIRGSGTKADPLIIRRLLARPLYGDADRITFCDEDWPYPTRF